MVEVMGVFFSCLEGILMAKARGIIRGDNVEFGIMLLFTSSEFFFFLKILTRYGQTEIFCQNILPFNVVLRNLLTVHIIYKKITSRTNYCNCLREMVEKD